MASDPFYELKVEIGETVHDLRAKMTRYHGLQSSNVERRTLSQQVEAGCQSVLWQLKELTGAVDRASANPARFNLTNEELSSRRRWIDSTMRQMETLQEALKTAAAAPAPPNSRRGPYDETSTSGSDAMREENNRYVGNEMERQALITRQQDQSLDDIELAVSRIGRMGRAIGEELEGQHRMLNGLDEDMDTTNSRLKATQKRMMEIIRTSGGMTQFCVMIILVVILVMLVAVAFM